MIAVLRPAAAIPLLALFFAGADRAPARQVTPDVLEAVVAHLHQESAENRAKADSMWQARGEELPQTPHAVFVLEREHLERMAGMSLADIEDLMRALHRRRVAARWCQLKCPLGNGDQKVTINWAIPIGKDGLVVEVELYGTHPRDEFNPSGLTAWMQRGSVHLAKRGQRWQVSGMHMGYSADYSAVP